MNPNNMPKKGSGLGTVIRHRNVPCDVERSGGGPCCCETRVEHVPAIMGKRSPRPPRPLANSVGDALRKAGW